MPADTGCARRHHVHAHQRLPAAMLVRHVPPLNYSLLETECRSDAQLISLGREILWDPYNKGYEGQNAAVTYR